MKKIFCTMLVVMCATVLFSQEKKVSMYNEISADASVGGYGSATVSLILSYTGGVNIGKYFSTGIVLGYDPLPDYMLSAFKLKGQVPLNRVLFYTSAQGGVRTTFKETMPSIMVSAGVGIKSKKNEKGSFNIGPLVEFINDPDENGWGTFVGIKLGYQF